MTEAARFFMSSLKFMGRLVQPQRVSGLVHEHNVFHGVSWHVCCGGSHPGQLGVRGSDRAGHGADSDIAAPDRPGRFSHPSRCIAEFVKRNVSHPSGSSGPWIGNMNWHAWFGCQLHVRSAHNPGKYALWHVLVIWEEQHATQLHACVVSGLCFFLLNMCFSLF